MRIEFTQTGGIGYFPGLNKPVTIEVDQLDKEEAEELKRLIEAAGFFDLPTTVGSPARGAADYQYYILTIEDGGRRHTVRVLVPIKDRGLNDLIRVIQKHVRAARVADRGSPSNLTGGKPRR